MQKLLEKKNKKKEKERRRGGRAPGLPLGFGPSQQAGPPHQPGRPSSPKRAPFLFPWCAPLQGRRPRRTTSPSTRRIRSTPPLDASASSPPTSTNSPLHLGRSLSLSGPPLARARSPPKPRRRGPDHRSSSRRCPRAPSTSSSSTPRFRTSWGALQRPGQAFPQPRSPSSAAIDSASPLRYRSLKGLHVPRRKPPHPPPSSGSPSCTVDGSRRRRRHCRMRPRPRARCAHPVHLRAKPWPPSSFRRFVEPTSAVC